MPNQDANADRIREHEAFNDSTLTDLLQCSLEPSSSPVHHLVSHYRDKSQTDWFDRILVDLSIPSSLDVACFGETCPHSLETLTSLKQKCKSAFQLADEPGLKCDALLKYYLAIAMAIMGHGRFITSRDRAEFEMIFVEVAEITPTPWNAFLREAALKLCELA
ncbi:MAG: hypothetical protein O7G85_11815 [Planctomycetota bacterium]|nr:hypothetical protein [Planctomycetota bacterium]